VAVVSGCSAAAAAGALFRSRPAISRRKPDAETAPCVASAQRAAALAIVSVASAGTAFRDLERKNRPGRYKNELGGTGGVELK